VRKAHHKLQEQAEKSRGISIISKPSCDTPHDVQAIRLERLSNAIETSDAIQ
jgi:hypothetical protein